MVKKFFPVSVFLERGYERSIGHEICITFDIAVNLFSVKVEGQRRKTHTDCAEQSEQQ